MKVRKRKNAPKISKTQSRYRFKPGFKEKVQERERQQYRAARGKDFELSGAAVLRSLEFIDDEAERLPVVYQETGETEVLPVIRLTLLAKLLDTSYQTVWRWSSKSGQLPEPVLVDKSTGRDRPVYHLEECRVMCRVIGEHLNQFNYYRSDHHATRDKLFDAITELRENNFGDEDHGEETPRKQTHRKPRQRSRRPGGRRR